MAAFGCWPDCAKTHEDVRKFSTMLTHGCEGACVTDCCHSLKDLWIAGWESGEFESAAAHGFMPELKSSLFQVTGMSDKLNKIPALCLSVFSMKVKTGMHFSSTNPERVIEIGRGGARWCYYHRQLRC